MIGIFGGTGVTGSQVVKALKAKGADFTCIVRDPEAAKVKIGEDIKFRTGDLSDKESLKKAIDGLETIFLLTGHSPMLKDLEFNAIEAAQDAGVSYLVKASGSEKGIRPDAPSKITQMHYHIEEAVKSCGIKWAITRPNYFMSNLMSMAEPIAKMGKLITPFPLDTGISMIHPADVGEASAEVILNQGYAGDAYFMTGALVTIGDALNEISKAVGKDIEYVNVTLEQMEQAMLEKNMPDWLVAHALALTQICTDGGMAGVTDWVDKLTGHPPKTLSEWVNSSKAAFGG